MRVVVVATVLLSLSVQLAAQTIETPIAFDSARRVLAITPRMADRLHLASPTWPVQTAEYREARLYSVQPAGGFVLVVQRTSGAVERFALSDAARTALQNAVDAATAVTGRPSGEIASDVVSEPAGNAFARHQTFLAATVYGPVASSLATDPSAAGAAYLLTTGLSFFVSYSVSQSTPITRAQSDLSGSLGLSAGVGAGLIGYAATGNGDRGVRAFALGSALAGTIAGVTLGERLTDAEAHAAAFGIENGASVGVLASSIAGANSRTMSAAATIAGAIGYPIGVSYPRRASYNVTAGDIEATSTASLIGVLASAAALGEDNHHSTRYVAGFLSAGYLAGGVLGDLWIARPFDLTQSQATIINVGAIAGAVVGAVVPVVFQSRSAIAVYGAPALGAALGTAAVVGGMPTADAAPTRVGIARLRKTGVRLSLSPMSLAAVAGGIAGHHVVARLTF